MTKRLYRARRDASVAGVCAGLANYFEIDPTLVRILFVIFSLMGGPGILVYIILWLVMPEEPKDDDYEYVKVKREEMV